MTLLTMQQRLARRLGANATTIDTLTASRYKDALNEVHHAVLRRPGLDSLRHAVVTFASVVDQQAYALPAEGVARINRIWETTNDRKLFYRPLSWLRDTDPDPQSGTPTYWIPIGLVEAHTQPSNASEIFVDSTSASDTGTAYLEGIITGGYTRTVSVTMTGTTAVTFSAAVTSFIQITKFYLSTAAVGTVTLHEDASGGTELSRITIGKTRAQFSGFLLYQTPSAVVTYYADITRGLPEMANNTDEPLLPEDFHDLVLDKAEQKLLRKADDPSRWQMLSAEIRRAELELQTWVLVHPDWQPEWGGPSNEFSRLGAFYPADSHG